MSRPGSTISSRPQLLELERLAGDDDRPVAEPHRGAVRQQQVAVGDVRVGAHRDRGHLEPSLGRPLVERLDVRDDLLELEPARVDAPGLDRPEHEGVVRDLRYVRHGSAAAPRYRRLATLAA